MELAGHSHLQPFRLSPPSRQFGSGQTLYEVATGRAHHDHLICERCGYIVEFESDEIEQLQDRAARTLGFNVLRQIFSKGPKPGAKQVVRDDDAAWVRVTSTAGPIASQFDGDYLGLRETMTFRSVPDLLPVAAPPAKNTPELR